jgi:DNA-binding response OmpR family regulator
MILFIVSWLLENVGSCAPTICVACRQDTLGRVVSSWGNRSFLGILEPMSEDSQHSHAAPDASQIAFGDLELDEQSQEVRRAGAPIELTPTEYRLLHCLMINPRRVLTRAELLDHVWEYDFGGDGRVLETYISYLRKKLDAHGPGMIRTVRGVGYGLQPPRV